MTCMLPTKRVDKYIKKHLDIVEKMPHGPNFVEKAFYWQYVMKKK